MQFEVENNLKIYIPQADKLAKWKNDEFVEYILEKKYKIVQNINTLSISFDKLDEEQEQVEIIIENVNFPLRVRMTHNAQKGVGSAVSVRLEFELESKGHWKIIVNSQ